ncbi:MAG: hypothetical protein WCV62_01510 [Candidatus Peribacteraceae bacterium]|jgi:hypothetical protein
MSTRLTPCKESLSVEELEELFQMPVAASDKQVPQGNLNSNVLFHTADGRPYLLRVENQEGRARELPAIINEYRGVGFLDVPGNGFFLRTAGEQHAFADALLQMNVPVISPICSHRKMQIIAYCQGARTLADLWKMGDKDATAASENAFATLMQCHGSGVAIGDRWGPNELVLPDSSLRFIDFDVGIKGPEAREFELVAFMYFLAYFAQQSPAQDVSAFRELCAAVLNNAREPVYSQNAVKKYLSSYPKYFSGEVPYSWNDTRACETFFTELHSHV